MKKSLSLIIFVLGCSSTQEKSTDFQVGITHTVLSPHEYRFISTGKASQDSIDEEDMFKRKVSACQASKDLYLKKIKQLEPDQKYRDYFFELKSQRLSEDNIYCENIVEYRVPHPEKK